MRERIAILSDIHALADTYGEALRAAREEGFDRLIILGDLLGYGTQVNETLELTAEAQAKDGATLVCGNHDQLYFDLSSGDDGYLKNMPDWIVESARWTFGMLENRSLRDSFDWVEKVEIDSLYVAHANPYEYGNWTYIRDEDSARKAAEKLKRMNYLSGVFGHVHRLRVFDFENLAKIMTVGSIGQPREAGHAVPQWSMVYLEDGRATIEARPIGFNVDRYRALLAETNLSEPTKKRLEGFFQ